MTEDDLQGGSNFEGGSEGGVNTNTTDNIDTQTQSFTIPDEYKEKGWAKFFDGKTGDELKTELFKSYDNSQSMIGKKVEEYLATTDLKQLSNYEEIKKNLSSQLTPEYNVPQDSKDYDLSSILKDENGNQIFSAPEESLNLFQDKFKEFGISKEQGQNLMKSYLEYEVSEFQKYTDADELESHINEMFKGNMQQRTQCETLIKEFLPEQDQQFIQATMPNVVVEMFYKVAKGLVDKYDYKEGNAGRGQSNLTMTQEEKDSEYNRITSELEALSRRPHNAQEKQALLNQLMGIYK